MMKLITLHNKYIVNDYDLQKCLEAEQAGQKALRKLLDELIENYKNDITNQILLATLCKVRKDDLTDENLSILYLASYMQIDNHIVDFGTDSEQKVFDEFLYSYER